MKVSFVTVHQPLAEYLMANDFDASQSKTREGQSLWEFDATNSLFTALSYLQEKYIVAMMQPVFSRPKKLTRVV